MKRFLSHALCWLLALAALSGPVTPARAQTSGHQHALLIGISTYDAYNKSGLFPNLDCDEDLKRIQGALVSTFHFDPAAGQITELNTPPQTTRAAILAAFDALVAETGPGDVVYVHYSGHGSQVPDATSPGGLDDTIVPADFKDDQSNEITGKALAAFLKRLEAKGPAQIALSFDCCHSATVTRGEAKKRGLSWAEYTAWYQDKYGKAPAQPVTSRSSSARPENVAVNDLDQPGYVVISACSNSSCAFECQDESGTSLGRLSYVLSGVLAKATPRTTYRQVFDEVNAIFKQKFSDQNPQLDGDPDTRLLGGRADPPQPSIAVSVVSPGHYALDAGKLQGMTAESTFALYAKDATTFTPATHIADAKISDGGVGLTSSTLEITQKIKSGLTPDDFSAAQAIEAVHNFGTFQVTLDADSVRQALPDQAAAILADLQTAGMVSTDVPAGKTPDVRAARLPAPASRGTAPVALVRGDTGAPIVTLDSSGDLSKQFVSAMERQARYRYATTVLNKDNTDGGGVQVKLRLVPAVTDKDADGNVVWKADAPLDASHKFHPGDYFTVEAQNPGDTDIFLTVLDIDSDGSIGQAWPKPNRTAQDNILKSGQGWTKLWSGSDVTSHALFHATSADSNELFKAIATDTYVSFKTIADRDMTRGPKGPFDVLLGPAAGVPITRAVEETAAPAGWATDTFAFSVEPATGRGITAMSK